MKHLSYVSKLVATPGRGEKLQTIRAILKTARTNNALHGVTGFLLIDGDRCFQILEGEAAAVYDIYRRIERDPRHVIVKKLLERDIVLRDFGHWSMGSVIRTLAHREIFLSHGLDGRIDAEKLTGEAFLALAVDLQEHEAAQPAKA